MQIRLYTPTGVKVIESDTITDAELQALGLNRDKLSRLIPRDLAGELDAIKTRLNKAGIA